MIAKNENINDIMHNKDENDSDSMKVIVTGTKCLDASG
jgi:hypothetical protein